MTSFPLVKTMMIKRIPCVRDFFLLPVIHIFLVSEISTRSQWCKKIFHQTLPSWTTSQIPMPRCCRSQILSHGVTNRAWNLYESISVQSVTNAVSKSFYSNSFCLFFSIHMQKVVILRVNLLVEKVEKALRYWATLTHVMLLVSFLNRGCINVLNETYFIQLLSYCCQAFFGLWGYLLVLHANSFRV